MDQNVFKFVTVRPVQRTGLTGSAISKFPVDGDRESVPYPRAGTEVSSWAAIYLDSSSNSIESIDKLKMPIRQLDEWLLERLDRPKPEELIVEIENLTGKTPSEVIKTDFAEEYRKVAKNVLALAVAPYGREQHRETLLRALYIYDLIDKLATIPQQLKTAEDIYRLLTYGVLLLPPVFRRPAAALARIPAMGDLRIVRQKLLRYEAGEIAHIENVLKGESKERSHRRTDTREEIIFSEKEKEQELEQDLQSTDRFEMQTEASQIIKEYSSLQAGLTVTGSYGPTISATANLDYAANHSKEESSRSATNYGREITERASSRIRERIREQRTVKTISVIEEINRHGVNNISGPDHVVGIYSWVDKVYEAQVFNYGQRLLLDFILPEPAAFFKKALRAKALDNVMVKDPKWPLKPNTNERLSPSDIERDNYLEMRGWRDGEQVDLYDSWGRWE